MIPQRFRLFTYNPAAFGLSSIQSDPMTVGAYVPQIWGGTDQLVRRNLLLNTATLATQNAAVNAFSYTLYIKGTGSVTLSGAATGTLNGTGASNRVSLQFTATAGTLTLTVSGSVTEGHLTRTATTDHSYQAVTDWTTEVYAYNAARQLPWLLRSAVGCTEDLTNAYWAKDSDLAFGSGSVANATTAPDGTATADLIVPDTSSAFHGISKSSGILTAQTGVSYCFSVYAKTSGYHLQITFGSAGFGASQYANFDLSSGVVANSTGGTAAIESAANGFYRCSFLVAANASATIAVYAHIMASTSATRSQAYAGDGASGAYLWGMNLSVAQKATYQQITTTWPATYTALAQAAGYPITLYSDRAGTIAVDSPETVVGKMLDLSTKGNHLVAPTDAARPLLKRDGNGNYYLLRDGVDDSLNVTLPNYGANCVTYQQDAATCNKATSVTLNGATSLSTPSIDYGRVLLQGLSNNDAKIQKYLNKLAGL